MALIQRRIKAFMLGLGCIREDGRQLVYRPAAAVANLPVKQGGIGHVDVQAHATAMQGKVAAALLHPHRHAWKQFMRANLEGGARGGGAAAGAAALIWYRQQQHCGGGSTPGTQRTLRHSNAGAAPAVPHRSMTAQQIHLEPVLGNHSVANAVTGGLFSSVL